LNCLRARYQPSQDSFALSRKILHVEWSAFHCSILSQALDEDPWLGTIEQFPTILHARASIVYDVTVETLQKTLVRGLVQLQESIRPIELSLSGQEGYLDGTVGFRIGVGNREGFDILDSREEDRVLRRILGKVFSHLDFSLDLHYKVRASTRHRVARDRYLARLSFQPGRAEVLVHHLKGLRRVDPNELVHFLVRIVNIELNKKGYGEVELEEFQTD
jgi:hypothetical protein